MTDFKSQMELYSSLTEKGLAQYMNNNSIPASLREVMNYSLFAGGKRLRPALVLACAQMCGGNLEDAIPFACGVEMIHTYSLIHDDLPALDNDDYRRGRLTSHKAFDEAKAILAGDALLSYAFEIMLKEALSSKKPENAINALDCLANAAGAQGMVAGQWVDVISEGKQIDEKTLEYIHKNKTAALIIGSLKAGAFSAGADLQSINDITVYGKELGLAFQIMDDILDVQGDSDVLGKPVGSDAANNKPTYVSLFGIPGAFEKAKQHTKLAIEALNSFGDKADFLMKLAETMLIRNK